MEVRKAIGHFQLTIKHLCVVHDTLSVIMKVILSPTTGLHVTIAAKKGNDCVNKKGLVTNPHKVRIEKAKQPVKIGKNKTGNGYYFYFNERLYLAESSESLITHFGTDQSVFESNTREKGFLMTSKFLYGTEMVESV